MVKRTSLYTPTIRSTLQKCRSFASAVDFKPYGRSQVPVSAPQRISTQPRPLEVEETPNELALSPYLGPRIDLVITKERILVRTRIASRTLSFLSVLAIARRKIGINLVSELRRPSVPYRNPQQYELAAVFF